MLSRRQLKGFVGGGSSQERGGITRFHQSAPSRGSDCIRSRRLIVRLKPDSAPPSQPKTYPERNPNPDRTSDWRMTSPIRPITAENNAAPSPAKRQTKPM